MLSRSWKLLISSFLIIALMMSSIFQVTAQELKKHWASDTLEIWNDRGLDTAQYTVDGALSRLDFITVLNAGLALNEQSEFSFTDVDPSSDAGKVISIAATAGYIKGYQDGSFKPSRLVTREEAAVMLSRIFSIQSSAQTSTFLDSQAIKAWSQPAVSALTDEGYLRGYPDGQFKPEKNVSLAELLTMLNNIVDVIIYEAGLYEGIEAKNIWIAAANVTIKDSNIDRNVYIGKEAKLGNIKIIDSKIGNKLISEIDSNAVSLENTLVGDIVPEQPEGTEDTEQENTPSPGTTNPTTPPGEHASSFQVTFDLNYDEAENLEPITIDRNDYIRLEQVAEVPVREGYRFAGWHTEQEPTLINGVSQSEWLFGEKYMELGDYSNAPTDNEKFMPVTRDTVLYARWVAPVEISNAAELEKIKDDLYGWFVLTDDIILDEHVNWNPIGEYHHTYEFANEAWWKLAFRGKLDGQGHSISGLTINTLEQGQHMGAFFGAVSNTDIENLTIKDYNIELEINDSYVYAAPLIGIAKGGNTVIKNVHSDGKIEVTFNDETAQWSFPVVSGLVGGNWSGLVQDSTVTGEITLNATLLNGGEVYVGGMIGEGYGTTVNAQVEAKVTVNIESTRSADSTEEDTFLDANVGGIHAGSTYILNSFATGEVYASLKKDVGSSALNVGGISGSGRYGFIENSRSDVDITVGEGKTVLAGGIQGNFNQGSYAMIGLFFGVTRYEVFNSIATGEIILEDYERDNEHIGAIVGELPPPLDIPIPGMDIILGTITYLSENNAYVAHYSRDQLADVNSTITEFSTQEEMMGDTLAEQLGSEQWIYNEHALPMPATIETWDLNAPRESIITDPDDEEAGLPNDGEEEADYAAIAGVYYADLDPYGELHLKLNANQTYELSGILGDSNGSYSATETSVTLVNGQDDSVTTYTISNNEILVPVYGGMFTLNLVKQEI